MKRLNLFNEDECLGSIYFIDNENKRQVIIDINNVYGLMWARYPQTIEIERLDKFISKRKTVEISVELDTAEGHDYIFRVSKSTLQIVDNYGTSIYESRCDDGSIEDDEECGSFCN